MTSLIIGIILATISGIISLIDKWKNKTSANYKKSNTIAICTFLLVIIGSIMTFSAGLKSQVEKAKSDSLTASKEKELRAINTAIKNKSDSILLLQAALRSGNDTLQNKISSLVKDNYVLSRELTENSLELRRNILGEGFCILEFVGTENNTYNALLRNDNNTSLYNISILLTDYTKLKDCKTKSSATQFSIDYTCYFNSTKFIDFNELHSKTRRFIDFNFIASPNEAMRKFETKINLRNASYVQQSIVFLVKGNCIQAIRLFQYEGGKYKLIKETKGFKDLDINWEKEFLPIKNRVLEDL